MSTLEKLAIDGHRRGMTWDAFWERYGADVRAQVPYDRRRFHQLFRKLLHLLTCGDTDGMHAAGDPDAPMQWDIDDDVRAIDDATTVAKIQLPLFSMGATT